MKSIVSVIRLFERRAQEIFEPFDTSVRPRAFSAERVLDDLSDLTAVQADFLRQAVRSVENGLFRGSIVIAFCAISDICAELAFGERQAMAGARPKWIYSSKEELLEHYPDYQVFEALRDARLVSKSLCKTLHSLLHRRNECAHPSGYSPGADEALGYIREAMRVVSDLGAIRASPARP